MSGSDFASSDEGAKQEPDCRYCTLEEAQALECNGCGDCCDSTRAEPVGGWNWGPLPHDLLREFNGGDPLIIPLLSDGSGQLQEVPWAAYMEKTAAFRCAAIESQPDGTVRCGIYADRPRTCGSYPVFAPWLDDWSGPQVWSPATMTFPRCTWYSMLIVSPGDPILDFRSADWTLPWDDLTEAQQAYVREAHDIANHSTYPEDAPLVETCAVAVV